jgi:hypothetical protein
MKFSNTEKIFQDSDRSEAELTQRNWFPVRLHVHLFDGLELPLEEGEVGQGVAATASAGQGALLQTHCYYENVRSARKCGNIRQMRNVILCLRINKVKASIISEVEKKNWTLNEK